MSEGRQIAIAPTSLPWRTLIIFAIRTRRVPFCRRRPSLPPTLAALTVVR